MRRYTIAKTLALFLGALSVVARSLPERQSGINVRSPGARRFSDPLTKLDFADGNVDQGVSGVTTTGRAVRHFVTLSLTTLAHLFSPHYFHNCTPLIPDGDPKERLERLGLVMVSEGVLDGNIYTAIYSMSNNTAFPKRDTNDLQGARCNTYCAVGNSARTIPSDCENLYNYLYSTWGQFTVEPSTSPSLPQDYDTKLTDARDRHVSALPTRKLSSPLCQPVTCHRHL